MPCLHDLAPYGGHHGDIIVYDTFRINLSSPIQKITGCWDGEHPHIPDHLFDVAIETDSDTIYYTHNDIDLRYSLPLQQYSFCSSSA